MTAEIQRIEHLIAGALALVAQAQKQLEQARLAIEFVSQQQDGGEE